MLFRTGTKNPKVMIRLGMLALAVSIVWPRFIPAGLGENLIDGLQGAFLGMALGLIIWGAMLGGFNRGAKTE